MWAFREGGFFDILDEYCNFCLAYERQTGYRCDLPSVGYAIAARPSRRCSPIAGRDRRSRIDPASTGGKEWEEFLRHYNEFCSERRGVPLFNQTPFLTREQARRAFGARLQQFAAIRRRPIPRTACSILISANCCRRRLPALKAPVFLLNQRASGKEGPAAVSARS